MTLRSEARAVKGDVEDSRFGPLAPRRAASREPSRAPVATWVTSLERGAALCFGSKADLAHSFGKAVSFAQFMRNARRCKKAVLRSATLV